MFSQAVTGDIQSLLETTSRFSHLSTRKQSEDSIHKQLAAFERLLQHTMSRFSNENAYTTLLRVTRWGESNQNPRNKHATKVAFKLKSVNQLQEIVEHMKTKIKQRTPEDENFFKNCELFLNDLLYLKDLKKYFNDEIYSALMKYHYDSNVDSPLPDSPTSSLNTGFRLGTTKTEDEDSGNGSQLETDDGRFFLKVTKIGPKTTKDTKERAKTRTDNGDDEAKLRQVVADLKSILKKWDGLLSEDTLDLKDFDPDSYHELMQFSGYSQFEALLRLVPDIFAKCYKSIDLAKSWLKISNIVLKEDPSRLEVPRIDIQDMDEASRYRLNDQGEGNTSTKEFVEQVKEIQSQIENVNQAITSDEELLSKYNEEMNILVGRDERVPNMSSRVDTIDSLMTLAAGEYQKTKTEQYALASKLNGCKKGSSTYTELKSHLRRLDTEVAQKHWKMKRLEYERIMVSEDLMVEAEIRPSFIRFIGDTKEKMEDLEKFLQVKREEKVKLEKQLALLKTNTERMRKIMRNYIGSASTTYDSASRESSMLSTPSDQGDLPESPDGNEADNDSPGPQNKSAHSAASTVIQKPKLVKRDLRPSSERLNDSSPKSMPNSGRVSRVGPKPALKTTPKRVWENV